MCFIHKKLRPLRKTMSFISLEYRATVTSVPSNLIQQSLYIQCDMGWKNTGLSRLNNESLFIQHFIKTALLLAQYAGEPFVWRQKGNRSCVPAFMFWLAVSVTLIELPAICSGVHYYGWCSAGAVVALYCHSFSDFVLPFWSHST